MCLTVSKEFSYLETWVTMLISTYKNNPSSGLAKTVSFYIEKLLHHDDIHFYGDKRCEYLAMLRFWHWHATKR